MRSKNLATNCRASQVQLKTLVTPIAAYVAAHDCPAEAIAEVVAELLSEAIEIELAAHRYLRGKGI